MSIVLLGTAVPGSAQVSGERSNSDSTIYMGLTPVGSFLDSILVDFEGVWSAGFERNDFAPCEEWLPDSLGGVSFVMGAGIGYSGDGEA